LSYFFSLLSNQPFELIPMHDSNLIVYPSARHGINPTAMPTKAAQAAWSASADFVQIAWWLITVRAMPINTKRPRNLRLIHPLHCRDQCSVHVVLFLIMNISYYRSKISLAKRQDPIFILPVKFEIRLDDMIDVMRATTFNITNEFCRRDLGWNRNGEMHMIFHPPTAWTNPPKTCVFAAIARYRSWAESINCKRFFVPQIK